MAYKCTICGALDTDPATLAKHEDMHRFMRAWMMGKANASYLGHRRARKPRTCQSPGCDRPAKLRSYCGKHYMQRWSTGDFS